MMGEVKEIARTADSGNPGGGKVRAMAEEKEIQRRTSSASLPVRYGDESAGELLGEIRIENEVVGTIASMAASDVDGIVSLVGKFSLGEMLGRKDVDKGVIVKVDGSRATVSVEVNIEYGMNIYDACHRLQRKVKDSVEEMTGLVVDEVNVSVRGIVVPGGKEAKS
jgi:uncharacterized alkaline shock family protein YloU